MGPGRIICIGPCQPKMTKVEVEELIPLTATCPQWPTTENSHLFEFSTSGEFP